MTKIELSIIIRDKWGLPIISEGARLVEVFEIGDRVIVEVLRGSHQDENGISSGGKWVQKSGIVESAHGPSNAIGFVRFDDGDSQATSLVRGDDGYPGRNIQAGSSQAVLPEAVLMDDFPEIDNTACREPYRRGIGQGFGDTEDGQE